MNVRSRMEQFVGRTTSGVLLGVAGIHAAWAAGWTWPAASSKELAELVVGESDEFPGTAATLAVAAASTGAALLIGERACVDKPRRLESLSRIGTTTAAGVLLLRGVAGLIPRAVEDKTPEFQRWNKLLYSPLCIALGLGAAVVSRSRH